MSRKILFYDTKSYDKDSFTRELANEPDIEVKFLKADLTKNTAELSHGYDAVCAFVNSDIGKETVEILHQCGVRLILMRCAGFNNVDLPMVEKCGIRILRVPGYSPEAVAEHAMEGSTSPTSRSGKTTSAWEASWASTFTKRPRAS